MRAYRLPVRAHDLTSLSSTKDNLVKIDNEKLGLLFDSVCNTVRTSPLENPESIVRQARIRWSKNSMDRAALHVLAASSLRGHRPEQSISLLNSDVQALAGDSVGNRLAGYAYLAQGDLDNAKNSFDQSVSLDPHGCDCWVELGTLAESVGEFDAAIDYFEKGAIFDDARHENSLSLARLFSRKNRIQDAIHTLRVGLLRDQRCPKLNAALARMLGRFSRVLARRRKPLLQQRVREEALECYKIVNAVMPQSKTLIAQGLIHQQLGHHESARELFEQAVVAAPKSASAIALLANANVDCGHIDSAVQQFEKAIAMDPGIAHAHFRYTRAKKFSTGKSDRAYVELLRQQLARPNLADPQRVYLHFSLAKVLDDMGAHNEAWLHYDQANRLKPGHSRSQSVRRRLVATHRSPMEKIADDTVNFFTSERIANLKRVGNASETPIFIVGMPRSGTTLTEQILSSHPCVAGAGELKRIEQIRFHLLCQRNGHGLQVGADSQPVSPENQYPQLLSSTPAGELRQHADEYLKLLDTFRTSETRVTDKMPTNFMHLGLIASLFPNATIIHCRRNPMDVLVSSYCQNLAAPFCDLEQLVAYHRQYRRLMAHWQEVLPIKIHTVDYEAMVTKPERHVKSLIDHCGLVWDDACLNFHANRRAVHTPSKWQVRQKMYTSSVEKWKRFESQLRPIADQIACEMESESTSQTLTGSKLSIVAR